MDNSISLEEIQSVNAEIIEQITGEYGVVEIINSGSVFELPQPVLDAIKLKVEQQQVQVLYFEVYYGYRKRLNEIRQFFPNQEIRYRIGIETFDDEFRSRVLNKPFSTADLDDLANSFYACCLLICVQGQTKEQIVNDIKLARANFKEITLNVFIDNGTTVLRDQSLVGWFVQEIYPDLKNEPNIEILIDNKDLGVYVQ